MNGLTMDKAVVSEARFIMESAKRGWQVAKPVHHSQGFDYVFRQSSSIAVWETVQVKTAYVDKGKIVVSLRRCNEKGSRPYSDGEFDWLFAVHNEATWMIPAKRISGIRSVIVLGGEKYEQYRNFRFFP